MSVVTPSDFSAQILQILTQRFGSEYALDIFNESTIIGYLKKKTKAANRGSKSRGSFANLYAIYVLVEDYLNHGFHETGNYSEYDQRPFGSPASIAVR